MKLVIVGRGGFASEVHQLVRACYPRLANPARDWWGYVTTDPEELAALKRDADDISAIVMGIGDPRVRLKAAEQIRELLPGREWPPLIHPSAVGEWLREVNRGDGTLICAGVVTTVDIKLGRLAVLNIGCTVGHGVRIGAGTVVNPGANISGGVTIGSEVLVGTGAQILQGLTVGDGATIGAGAVVVRDVPPGLTVVGVPAKVHCP
jgi:sugar O-acyltransferase (sialic acid O-acetyltransferase NeuD family)